MPNFRNCTRTNAVEHLAKRVVGELHDWWVEFSKLHGPIYVSLAQMHIFFSNTSPAHVNRWGRCLLLLLKVSGSNKRYRLVRNGDLKMGHTPHMAIFMGLQSLDCGGFPFSCSWSRGDLYL